jgi:uncharacterized DUF497 family protein
MWDESKRLANLVKHGLDFADIESGFDFDTAIVRAAKSSSTGRRRIKIVGKMNGADLVAVIAAPLGSEALSIVSLRPASKQEGRLYES